MLRVACSARPYVCECSIHVSYAESPLRGDRVPREWRRSQACCLAEPKPGAVHGRYVTNVCPTGWLFCAFISLRNALVSSRC